MNKAAARKRWKTFQDLREILRVTENLQTSPFGQTEAGFEDFRGVPLLTVPFECGGGWEHAPYPLHLEQCDFSYSDWKGFDLGEASITNALFIEADFENTIVFYKTRFQNILFENCRFKNIRFVQSELSDVVFRGLKPRDTLFLQAQKIEGGRFEGDMKGICFNESPMRHTHFAGMLTDCRFFGHPSVVTADDHADTYLALTPDQVANRMDGVDFSQAALVMCHIGIYCYLDKTIPPDAAKNCFVRLDEDFFNEGLRLIKQQCDPARVDKTIKWFELFYKPDIRRPYGVLGPADFVKALTEQGAADFYRAFLQAAINTGRKI
ncbi:uncharacterized protein YjbI with pentapeptide repeats [Neisseria sp. HSC-16F19]|nr:pentapeptide repeat-containing protein [Neisseria sp. HSC-16F19]MCP2041523.1 uncharacterized protein YjbI with pentapeptide repeats [Neisseria sp. HSC-16F19]